MAKINESAFPYVKKTEFTDKDFIEHIKGLSKLEYTAIKIFCAMFRDLDITRSVLRGFSNELPKEARKYAIEQAKLLLQECEGIK